MPALLSNAFRHQQRDGQGRIGGRAQDGDAALISLGKR